MTGAGERRSWLFLPAADEAALLGAQTSGADVLIQEFEDFTPPAQRPRARDLAPEILATWRASGVITAVRVNELSGDGMEDLAAAMKGQPSIVLLPKVSEPEQIIDLEGAVAGLEREFGYPLGSTELLPNIESARGLVQIASILAASKRVRASLLASEDMAADLGAERGPDGQELAYVRQRFHVECTAANVLSIDSPYTWRDEAGLRADTLYGRRLGYRAKSAVAPGQAAIINTLMTPSDQDLAHASRIVEAFETARANGDGRAEVDGSLVEIPIYLNAKRLLERAR